MADNKEAKTKQPFFKNTWNVVLTVATVGLAIYVGYSWFSEDEDGRSKFHDLTRPGGLLGREKPSSSEVEAHFKDKAGSLPVDKNFDSDPDALCGNGKSFFWTSKPPKKPIPDSWEAPPVPGTDPNYQGPEPGFEFKESPYAMPSSKRVLARPPIVDLRDPSLMDEIKKAVALGATGKVGYLGAGRPPGQFAELGPNMVPLSPSMFMLDDDEPVARQLIEQGVEFVLVDRAMPRVGPWIEEHMDKVALRLRDAVSLSWFHPAVLGSRYVLYRVAEPFVIPKHIKRRIAQRIRSRLTGGEPVEVDFNPPRAAVNDKEFRAIVSLRWRAEPGLKGRKLTKKIAHGGTLIEAIDAATDRIRKGWGDIRRSAIGNPTLTVDNVPTDMPKAIENMEIEVEVIHDICALTDRTASNMVWYLELGLEGLILRGKGDFRYLEPAYATHMEVKSEVVFLERLFQKNRMSQFLREPKKAKLKRTRGMVLNESAWRTDRDHRLARFRTVHWVETVGGDDIVELYRGIPLKTIWDVSRASLVRSLQLGADWLMNNQTPDGQYAYKYTPTNKPGRRWDPGGNIVRHALNPYTLLMVNKIEADEKYVKSAKKGIEFTLNFLRKEGNRCVICHRDPPARYYNAKIGTVAVTILSILKLGDVADISEYDEVLRCMGEELLYMQDPNGHFWQYDVPPDHPYYGAESTIAPGEFVFALARMYQHYKDERYKESIDRALPWYMASWRKLLSERTPEGIFDEEHRVNLIGIVPWLVTAMNDLHLVTGDKRYADLAFEQQDWIDKEFFWYQHRSQYPDYVGASFKVHRELPAINSCQYTEGAAAAYDLAKRVSNPHVEARRKLLIHGMRFCLQLQFDSYGSTFFLPVPEEGMGGYRYTLGHLRLRNDYSYHAMAAIAQAVEYLNADDYPAERPMRIRPVLRELLGGLPNPAADTPRGAAPASAPPAEGEVAAPAEPGEQPAEPAEPAPPTAAEAPPSPEVDEDDS